MYTIKRAAELTGISVATLRAWERRYGVVSPKRSEGGYRLYGTDDVRALAIMNSLVNEGWSPREAATETMSRLESAPESATRPSRAAAPAGSATAGPAQGAVPRAGVDATEALVRAAERLDAVAASAVIDDRFALGTFEHVVDAWLMPALERLGEAWADGRVSVAGEHLVSYAVQRRLASAYEAAAGRGTGPSVVLGLPAGARHELGLLAFAVAARRAGLATTYVGADLPVGDWVGAVAARRAAGVVLSVPCRADLTPAHQIVSGLRAADPHLVVGVGGRFQDEVGNGSVPLGHSIEDGVAELVRQLPVAP